MIPTDTLWLPCERCSWARPDCTCQVPISVEEWDRALTESERRNRKLRDTARRAAEWDALRTRWAA